MNIREEIEAREKIIIKDPRSWSVNSRGREKPEEESDMLMRNISSGLNLSGLPF